MDTRPRFLLYARIVWWSACSLRCRCFSRSPSVPFFFFLMFRRPPRSPLFPSPTLFRSDGRSGGRSRRGRAFSPPVRPTARPPDLVRELDPYHRPEDQRHRDEGACCHRLRQDEPAEQHRSEEHTSELQSQSNLVCRLLLE